MKIREYTNKILDLVDEGSIDENQLICSLLMWLPESEVKEFFENNYSFNEEEAA
jgi:hypothetical protein